MNLTKSQKETLLSALERFPKPVYVSNTTVFGALVHWKPADALAKAGLAKMLWRHGTDELRLTAEGLRVAQEIKRATTSSPTAGA